MNMYEHPRKIYENATSVQDYIMNTYEHKKAPKEQQTKQTELKASDSGGQCRYHTVHFLGGAQPSGRTLGTQQALRTVGGTKHIPKEKIQYVYLHTSSDAENVIL